jgi:uncharacterized protein YndB with AHSA1/START domain
MSETMTSRARVLAPIKAVHHALTDAGSLRVWLAEHAEVDLPGRYAFWGRHTPEGDAPHQRPLHVDDTTPRFTWLLGGEETTVEFRLEEESADATVITVSQTHFSFQEMMSGSGIRGVLHTFWALAIANLVDHVEGRPITSRLDFTSADLREEVVIDASPEEVYDSLIDSGKVTRWFGVPFEIDPRVGGDYTMSGMQDNPAKILDLEPGGKLSVDWGGAGVSTWELAGSEGKTRLTLVQSGFQAERPPYASWAGIISGLAELRRFHELADWRPIWLGDATPEDAPATV